MRKKIVIGVAFCANIFFFSAYCFSFKTRFAVGPAWNQFFSNEAYNLTELAVENDVSDTKFFNTGYNFMPYAESRSCFTFYRYCNLHFLAGGGAFNRGWGAVNYITNIPPSPFFPGGFTVQSARKTLVDTTMSIIDVSAGPVLYGKNNIFSINPVGGYMRINQDMTYVVSHAHTDYFYKTHWRGPYFGIDVLARITPCISLRAWYKRIIGSVASCVKFSTTAAVINVLPSPLSDATTTQWKTSMRGNVFHLEAVYNLYKAVHLGTGIEYLKYYNHQATALGLKSINTDFGSFVSNLIFKDFITGGTLKKVSLQQVMWTFFVELQF